MSELSPKVEEVYRTLVEKFKLNKNKPEIIIIMLEFCNRKDITNMDVYNLKKKMEIQFSIDVDCQYCYKTTSTPVNYGCDLREIFFDRENNLTQGAQPLLDVFEQKKIDDVWHIMTDIDDTLYPNTEHGSYIAGSDISWHSKTPYPGIIKFYELFYNKLSQVSRYSTILSATPGCLKNSKIIKHKAEYNSILGDFGFIQGEESKSKLIPFATGIFRNFFNMRRGNYGANSSLALYTYFGNMKFERFTQYLKLFPEYKILFIGDNGQGDVIAGKQMLRDAPNRCKVFIHQVCEDGQNFKAPTARDSIWEGLYFFKTYNDLGRKFQEIGIFNENDILQLTTSFNEAIENPINTAFKHLYVADYKQSEPKTKSNGGKHRRASKTRRARRARKSRRIRKTKKGKR
jgi:hypothetical protein